MIIKFYEHQSLRTHIFENITDVIIHGGTYGVNDSGPPRTGGVKDPIFWEQPEELNTSDTKIKFIDYTDADGTRTRLCVTGCAYVCNDNGKTIETVKAWE